MNLRLRVYKLKNGVEIYYKPIFGAKNMAIYLGLQGGVLDENKNGLAHLLEHMLVVEAKFYKKQIEKKFGGFSWGYEANTYKGYIEFGFNTAKKNFIPVVMAILQALQKPVFSIKDIIREKKFILKEWHKQKNLDYGLADHNLDQAIFKAPFSNPTVGDYKIIKSLNRDDLLTYWGAMLKGNKLKIAISGDVSGDDLLTIKKLFTTIRRGRHFAYSRIDWYKNKRKNIVQGYLPVKKIFLSICIPVTKVDFYKPAPAVLLSSIFAGSTQSLLDKAFRNLKINKSIGAGVFEFGRNIYLNVSFRASSEKVLKSLSIFIAIWRKLYTGVSVPDILMQTKKFFAKENKEKINCAVCTAKEFIQESMYTASERQVLLPIHKAKTFSMVTQNDIIEVVKSFAEPDHWTISIVGSKNIVTNKLIHQIKEILIKN